MVRSLSHARSIALRVIALSLTGGFLLGANTWNGAATVVAPITVTINAINGTSVITTTTEVTRIDNNGSCEYRLEFMAEGDTTRGINEIGGNRGAAQRINSCSGLPPSFTATKTSNAAWFDEQSAYYWAKRSRDYAKTALWNTPPGWEGRPITFGSHEVSLIVLTPGDEFGGFRLACSPRGAGADGCMRYWPGQNPKIYIPAGRALARVVSHEYGHYAAGYVFGHQETLTSGGFQVYNCVHRAFQEGIAEVFKQLFLHHELTTAGVMTPLDPGILTIKSQWSNDCSSGEYVMSDPLWHAFAQAVWGTGLDAGGAAVSVPWPNAAAANTGIAHAFIYALATTKDFRMHGFAVAALEHIDKNQPNVATAVRTIFAGHGLTLAANGRPCIENQECTSNYCDNGDGTSRTRLCMPRSGTGQGADPCTHDNQCASNSCAGLHKDAAGNWVPGMCVARGALGATCNANTQCSSAYCDAGFNTANTNKCMPRGGTGQGADPCTHDNQCASNSCAGLRKDAAGNWVPGMCVAQGALSDDQRDL